MWTFTTIAHQSHTRKEGQEEQYPCGICKRLLQGMEEQLWWREDPNRERYTGMDLLGCLPQADQGTQKKAAPAVTR